MFISYSHADAEWLEKLKKFLKPLENEDKIKIWDDKEIKPGDQWEEEIEKSISAAKAAVLLVTPCTWDRSATHAALGGELPTRTLSIVRRVPSSTLTHVSASPPFHPGRSDFSRHGGIGSNGISFENLPIQPET